MKKETTTSAFYTGVGRRKTAVAQARVLAGNGAFTVNNETVAPQGVWLKPLSLVGKRENLDVSVVVRGGGITSQSEAIGLAIARALVRMDNTLKTTLRKAGLVTVDARVKERKKPGLKRARKAPQWAKR
jgi:small subunit ribosomal protein S9